MAITGMTGMGDPQTEIKKMYEQYLGRQPDRGGLSYYTDVLSRGGSLDGVRQSISGSPEAMAYKPPSPSASSMPTPQPAPAGGLLTGGSRPNINSAPSGAGMQSRVDTSPVSSVFAQQSQQDVFVPPTYTDEEIARYKYRTMTPEGFAASGYSLPTVNGVSVGNIGDPAYPDGQSYQGPTYSGTGANPNFNSGAPVLDGAITPDYAAGNSGDTVGGVGNSSGMGYDIEWGAPSTQTMQAGEVFSTAAGDYQVVDNGYGQLGLAPIGDAATGGEEIIYNLAAGKHHVGIDPNTGEAWYQQAQGQLPGLYEIPVDVEASAQPNLAPQSVPAPAQNQAPTTQQTAAPVAPAVSVEEVNALYNQFLGRDGNSQYLQTWADSGMSMSELANAIANSPEGKAFAAGGNTTTDQGVGGDSAVGDKPENFGDADPQADSALMSQQEAQAYVTGLYQSILGRAPKREFLDIWTGLILRGEPASSIQSRIFLSAEFKDRANGIIDGYYQALTGAAGNSSEQEGYVGNARQQQKTFDQIYQEIYDSDAARAFRAKGNGNENEGNEGDGTTPTGPGSQESIDDAVDDTRTYDPSLADASADADAEDANVTTRTVSPNELVENRINNLLASNSPYIQRARTSGLQFANQRGLLNSSIAAQASEEAAIARAGEIASQDASTYAQAALANQQAQNTAGLQDAQLGTNVSIFNVGEDNVTNRFNASSTNEAGQFNAAAANQSIQNFLQREQVRNLQDDQQIFTAAQNEADRVLRETLQNAQFDFTSSENSLDRNLQTALQENQFAFTGTQAELDREQQTALQNNQFAFQGGENAADRAQQLLIADKEIAFRTWSQTNEQDWQSAQNALQLEFQYYNSNAQVSQSIMYSTMEGIAQIYADPNLTTSAKSAAIQNLLNSSLKMPELLSTIMANVKSGQETNTSSNYNDDGVWIGEGYPNWAAPPSGDGNYATVVTPIVNPNTGQIYMAPNDGWTYEGQTSGENPGGDDSGGEDENGNFTGDPSTLVQIDLGTYGGAINLYRDPATNRLYQLINGNYKYYNPSTGAAGGR